jgi:CelD/BcsL family acetyltransferase involved in cellulose biosynthesis
LPALQGLDGQDDGLAVLIDGAGTHVIFDFTSNFAEYLARLTKARRGQFRRNVRALTDGFAMTREDSVPDAAEFDAFIKFHGLQWQASGRGGHFSDWPGSAAFYHDLAAQTANAKLVQLDRLNGTGGALATEFSLISGRTAHWRLPARRLDAEIDRLSAGKVVFLLMFERMVADGITRIEAGRGEYEYKTDYGGQTVLVHRLIVHRSNGMARRRLKLLLEWADLLNLVYYRLWFLKLSPRLRKLVGGGPRPLWRQWIRTRL